MKRGKLNLEDQWKEIKIKGVRDSEHTGRVSRSHLAWEHPGIPFKEVACVIGHKDL